MNREQIVNKYLEHLEKSNFDAIVKLFDSKAMINSPFFGKIDMMSTFRKLFSHVKSCKIEDLHLFEHLKNPDSMTVHYVCNWTFQDGSTLKGDCVNVFEFLPNSDKIKALTFLFDASKMPKYSEKPMRKSA
jgi:hypothetical protein